MLVNEKVFTRTVRCFLSGTYSILPVNVTYDSVAPSAMSHTQQAQTRQSDWFSAERSLAATSLVVTYEIHFLVPLNTGAADPFSQVTTYYNQLNTQLINSITKGYFNTAYGLYCTKTANCTATGLSATAVPASVAHTGSLIQADGEGGH
jgi:hypothetical protein